MCAYQTYTETAHTFYAPDGRHTSTIDSIFGPASLELVSARTLLRAGDSMQLASTFWRFDHRPASVVVKYRTWYEQCRTAVEQHQILNWPKDRSQKLSVSEDRRPKSFVLSLTRGLRRFLPSLRMQSNVQIAPEFGHCYKAAWSKRESKHSSATRDPITSRKEIGEHGARCANNGRPLGEK